MFKFFSYLTVGFICLACPPLAIFLVLFGLFRELSQDNQDTKKG